MISCTYINHLESYRKTIKMWLDNTLECRAKKVKNNKLNAAQLLDIENTSKDRIKVVNEICRLDREIQSLKISTSNLFKTQNPAHEKNLNRAMSYDISNTSTNRFN